MKAMVTNTKRAARWGAALAGLLAVGLASQVARAEVTHEGKWPDPSKDKIVSLDVSHESRDEALKKLADAAGWSIATKGVPDGDVGSLHVKNQPASKVLDLLLDGGDYVATREGDIVRIVGETGAASGAIPPVPPVPPVPAAPEAPPAPPAPVAPPAPSVRGDDRTIAGGNLRIEKSEVVHDVTVFGGNVDVYGTVTGDMQVMGGNVRLHEGSHVMGDASAVGGKLTIENGVDVDGDVSVLGGDLNRSDGCKIRGSVVTKGGNDSGGGDGGGGASAHPGASHETRAHKLHSTLAEIGGAITSSALLFVFGAVLLALTSKRMEMLRVEAASRPMRSFALGIVGFFASIAIVLALCITIVGIPVAVVGVLLATFAAYAGVCAVLTVVGQALLKHKTSNPYVHLAVGCALFLVTSAIPFVGTAITLVVAAVGIGVIVATRVGGLVPARKRPNQGPYRTPADAPVDA